MYILHRILQGKKATLEISEKIFNFQRLLTQSNLANIYFFQLKEIYSL